MNTNTLIINKKAKKAIEKYGMLKNGSKIIVGLSGGADSVCLLHFLHSVKDEYNLTICAAHVNHGIRGEEAVSDSEFAREMANSLNIEFKLSEVDCIEEAELHNETVEEAGRRLRYEFFDSLRTQESDVIATAHNCNDNAETVIFNVSRGSALNGAKGIPPKRDDRIIRPLIFCTRAEIEGYCEENNLSYVTDSTNLSDDYTRNRIRHIIIPELEKINPQAVTAFSRFTEGVRSDCDYLDSVALEAYTKAQKSDFVFDINYLNSLHFSIKSRVILKAVNEFSHENPDSKKIDEINECLLTEKKIQLYKNCYCESKNKELKFFSEGNNKKESPEEVEIRENEFSCEFGQYSLNSEKYSKFSQKFNDLLLDNLIDCDTIYGNLVLRTRKEGDKITLRKRHVTKTLKKLFIEEGVPACERCQVPVLADEKGVVWVFGFGVNKRNAATENTRNLILVRGEKNDL